MTEQVCTECKKTFLRPATGRPRLTCGPDCKGVRLARLRDEAKLTWGSCDIEGCDKQKRSAAAAWCEMHYARNRLAGSPTATRRRRPYIGHCYQCGAACGRRRLFCDEICQRRDRMGATGRISDCVVCDGPLPDGARLGTAYCSYECEREVQRGRLYGVDPRWLYRRRVEIPGCEICGDPVELVVDHDHDSGQYRGLLCGQCNVGLGMFADNPERLRAAARYLEETGGLGDERSQVQTSGEVATAA